jgi:hypothetical protein
MSTGANRLEDEIAQLGVLNSAMLGRRSSIMWMCCSRPCSRIVRGCRT